MIYLGLKEFNNERLEILSMNIKRGDDCKYQHEYTFINTKTFKRFKISFKTNSFDVIMGYSNFSKYGHSVYCNVKLNEVEINPDDKGEILTVQDLDWDK